MYRKKRQKFINFENCMKHIRIYDVTIAYASHCFFVRLIYDCDAFLNGVAIDFVTGYAMNLLAAFAVLSNEKYRLHLPL